MKSTFCSSDCKLFGLFCSSPNIWTSLDDFVWPIKWWISFNRFWFSVFEIFLLIISKFIFWIMHPTTYLVGCIIQKRKSLFNVHTTTQLRIRLTDPTTSLALKLIDVVLKQEFFMIFLKLNWRNNICCIFIISVCFNFT